MTKQDRINQLFTRAHDIIRQGKAQFTPTTTNSLVDEWLSDYNNLKEYEAKRLARAEDDGPNYEQDSAEEDVPGEWDKAVKTVQSFPMTWYPKLLQDMVKAAYKKKVFKPFGASRNINAFENTDEMKPYMQDSNG